MRKTVFKSKKDKKNFKLVWPIFPMAGIIFLGLWISWLCLKHFIPDYALDNLFSLYSIIISFGTLLTTLAIALYIYNLQKRDADQYKKANWKQQKKIMGAAVANGVSWLICAPEYRSMGACYLIRDFMNEYSEELAEIITSQKELQALHVLVGTLDKATQYENDAVDCGFLYRDWLKPIMTGRFSSYYSYVINEKELLHKDVYGLLQSLGVDGAKNPYEDLNVIYDLGGNILFQKTKVLHNEAFDFANEIYDIYKDEEFFNAIGKSLPEHNYMDEITELNLDGNYVNVFEDNILQFSGKLGYDEMPVEGFIRMDNYIGFVRHQRYYGPGKEHEGKYILREGYWYNGELMAGIKYWNIIRVPKNILKWNPYSKYYENANISDLVDCSCQYVLNRNIEKSTPIWNEIIQNGIEEYYIADIKILGRKYLYSNIRSLRDFLSVNNPKLLDCLSDE